MCGSISQGSTLVVEVSELQVVNNVLFQGNKKIKDVELANAVQLKPRSPFSTATMESDAEAIRQAYSRVGRDDATVTTQVVDLGENRVNVVYEINEGRPHQDRRDQFQRQQRLQRPASGGRDFHQALQRVVFRIS
jgi:outer membrane protein assembly factor BamA